MKDLKTTILSSLENGKNVYKEREVNQKEGKNYSIYVDDADNILNHLHQKSLKLKVAEIIEQPGARTFRLVPVSGYLPVFEAGQYLNVFTEIEGVRTSRPYSICSSPKQRSYYEITVARIPNGFVSDYLLDHAKVGDVFETSSPAGTFRYNPVFHSRKSVFVAGGSGITPFMSMLREALYNDPEREIHLIYGARNENTMLFKDELLGYAKNFANFKLTLVFSEPVSDYPAKRGFVTKELLSELIDDFSQYTFYLCGPQIMNDSVEKSLTEFGVKKRWLRRELFINNRNVKEQEGYPSELTGEEEFKVTIKNTGITILAKAKETLLTALERNHIRVNVCCHCGECSLCRVQLVSGKVFLSKGALLRHVDKQFGFIHSCKAYPISDIEILL